MAKIRKRPKTYGPDEANPAFIMTRLVTLSSVAYWALKPLEVRILNVIEIEHMLHGGKENGGLVVTRRQFQKRDIHKDAIAPSLRALEALGFIEITQRGAAGIGDHAQAHRFRLTYVQPGSTDEWRKFHDQAQARAIARTARQAADIRSRQLGLRGAQKQIAGPKNGTGKVRKTGPAGPENGTTIYISGEKGSNRPTPPGLAPPPIAEALLSDGALPSNANAPQAAAPPNLVWTKPVVRELFGQEAMIRRQVVELAGAIQ